MSANEPPAAAELRALITVILDPAHAPSWCRPEVLALVTLLRRSSGFEEDRSEDLAAGETRGPEGLAISPAMAAKCAEDFVRTVVFLRGVRDAIDEARQRAPGRPVHVLYAGCGPLAILCLPLMAVLADDAASFTLIDMHDTSIAAVQRAVDAFGFAAKVNAVLCVDAFHFEPDPARPVDVIVLEVMTACLEKEPQVELTRHLVSRSPGAVLVPAAIRIEAALMPAPDVNGACRVEPVSLGTIFELSAAHVGDWQGFTGDLPAGSVTFPQDFPDGLYPMLRTTIRTHGAHLLGDFDSGLTIPRAFPPVGTPLGGATVHFRYHCGECPMLMAEADSAASAWSRSQS